MYSDLADFLRRFRNSIGGNSGKRTVELASAGGGDAAVKATPMLC
jgi:hypothetical protein